jgi:signal transduction histidine kinase
MSEEFVRRRLFKPFDTTKGSSGMGIGAYQAREVVRSFGGELMVASEAGKGTIVRILLPHERSPVEHLEVATAADGAEPRA